jgi:hypothetical protein
MATFQLTARRLILAGGFAVAVAAAPAIAVFAVPASPSASVAQGCAGGEEADTFTGNCVPHTVPNSGASPFNTSAANPDLPVVNVPGGGGAIPCTGANSGQCIGLAEEQQAMGPQAVPNSTVGHSPTVTN